MNNREQTRRGFISTSAGALGGSWLALHLPAIEAAAAYARLAAARTDSFAVFTPDQARTFSAFAARIFPSDDLPGATEAGVVYFADRALETFAAPMLPPIQAGLAELEARVKKQKRRVANFAELAPARQDAIMRAVERAPWFGLGRLLVVYGMFSDPSYGGNKDGAGWRLIGFEDRGSHQPPFGYYDAEYARERAGGAQ
jgi:gluconate 2-dehydrogenase gamma chain